MISLFSTAQISEIEELAESRVKAFIEKINGRRYGPEVDDMCTSFESNLMAEMNFLVDRNCPKFARHFMFRVEIELEPLSYNLKVNAGWVDRSELRPRQMMDPRW